MVKFIVLLFLQMMMKKQCDAVMEKQRGTVNEVECKMVNKKELKNDQESMRGDVLEM